mmetsp:Transcript_131958/g.329144  ORF Transcript_131958/g.329144 Transcript_131958/m.329144 type:complete len:244 (-) Transcript_131958:42-773(-)
MDELADSKCGENKPLGSRMRALCRSRIRFAGSTPPSFRGGGGGGDSPGGGQVEMQRRILTVEFDMEWLRAQPVDDGTFCWLVTMSSGGEPQLVRHHFAHNVSIFACNSWSVFTNTDTLEPVPVTNIGPLNSSWGLHNSWYNTAVFLRAWVAMAKQGKYSRHAWTIKVDPDTVFFPARLLGYLQEVPPSEPWFVQNAVGFLGPMEVFSNGAVHAFAEKAAELCSHIISTEEDSREHAVFCLCSL